LILLTPFPPLFPYTTLFRSDLAREQHVPDAWRNGGREIDDAESIERSAGASHAVIHRQIFHQRGARVDRQPKDLAAAQSGRNSPLLVRQRRDIEKLGYTLPLLYFAEQHFPTPRGERHRGGRAHGAFAR